MNKKLDTELIRYHIKKRGYTIKTLSVEMGLSVFQLNYKIVRGTFTIQEVLILLDILKLKFEELFKEVIFDATIF